jgi:hypothetical protein
MLQLLPAQLVQEGWPAVTLKLIGQNAFDQVEQIWTKDPLRRLQWDWPQWCKPFKYSPHRVEVSVWLDTQLAGLILGRHCPDPTPPRVELHYIERRPGPCPLKGQFVDLAIDIGRAYGLIVDASELRICNPIAPLHDYYQAAGLELVRPEQGQIYCKLPLGE